MGVPKPISPLSGDCSAIYDNTLYAYSTKGFQKIDLKTNGTWKPLDEPSAKVTGPACVVADIGGDTSNQALYLVGGTGSPSGYSGLQRFSFNDEKWTKLTSESTSMRDRTSHTAGYVPKTSTIVVVASDGSTTWTILTNSASTSVNIQGGTPGGMGAVSSPTILPWNDTSIALVSGDGSNNEVSIFDSQASHWVDSYAALPAGAVQSSSHLALISDSNGNYVLQDFNMAAKPNTVTSYQLYKEGEPQNPAGQVGGASTSKRSLSDMPSYNGSFAGTTTRTDYSLAQSGTQAGLVVIGSGDDSNALSVFNQTTNGWANATELFYGSPKQDTLHHTTTTSATSTSTTTSSSTSSATATTTTTPAATTSAAAPAPGDDSSSVNLGVVIGATLGSCCGAILIILILLFLLRRARQKREQAGVEGGGDPKGRLSFQDQGIEPLAEGAYPMARSPVPVAAVSNDSLAIMTGKYNGEKSLHPPNPNYGYGLSQQHKGLSPIASSGLAPSSMYSDASVEPSPTASSNNNKPGDRTTDEGWGKYFEDGNSRDLTIQPTNRSTVGSVYGANLAAQAPQAGDRSAVSSIYTDSDYRGSAWPMSNLAPLNFGQLARPQPLGHVASGSPTTNPSTGESMIIPEGQSARISSADSISLASEDDPHDTNWTGAQHSSWLGRPPSSQYSTSFYNTSTQYLPGTQGARQSNDMRSHGRRSSVVIPDNIDELPTPGISRDGRATANTDMSWLNLNADR